jgi:hypothetical protein
MCQRSDSSGHSIRRHRTEGLGRPRGTRPADAEAGARTAAGRERLSAHALTPCRPFGCCARPVSSGSTTSAPAGSTLCARKIWIGGSPSLSTSSSRRASAVWRPTRMPTTPGTPRRPAWTREDSPTIGGRLPDRRRVRGQHAVVAVECGPQLGGVRDGPPGFACAGHQVEWPELVQADHSAAVGSLVTEGQDGLHLGDEVRIVAAFPGRRGLPRHPAGFQDPRQVLPAEGGDQADLFQMGGELGQAPRRERGDSPLGGVVRAIRQMRSRTHSPILRGRPPFHFGSSALNPAR